MSFVISHCTSGEVCSYPSLFLDQSWFSGKVNHWAVRHFPHWEQILMVQIDWQTWHKPPQTLKRNTSTFPPSLLSAPCLLNFPQVAMVTQKQLVSKRSVKDPHHPAGLIFSDAESSLYLSHFHYEQQPKLSARGEEDTERLITGSLLKPCTWLLESSL